MSINRRSFLKLIGATAATSILPKPKGIAEDAESSDPDFVAGKKTIEGIVSGFKSSQEIKEILSRELEKQRVILSIYEQHALIAMVLTDIFDVSTWRGSIHEVNLTFRSSRHWMALDGRRFDFTLYLPGTPLWLSSRYTFSGTLHITGGTLYPNGPPSYSVQVLITPEGISCTYD